MDDIQGKRGRGRPKNRKNEVHPKLISVRLSKDEAEMIGLMQEMGYGSRSEIIRTAVRDYYKQTWERDVNE